MGFVFSTSIIRDGADDPQEPSHELHAGGEESAPAPTTGPGKHPERWIPKVHFMFNMGFWKSTCKIASLFTPLTNCWQWPFLQHTLLCSFIHTANSRPSVFQLIFIVFCLTEVKAREKIYKEKVSWAQMLNLKYVCFWLHEQVGRQVTDVVNCFED